MSTRSSYFTRAEGVLGTFAAIGAAGPWDAILHLRGNDPEPRCLSYLLDPDVTVSVPNMTKMGWLCGHHVGQPDWDDTHGVEQTLRIARYVGADTKSPHLVYEVHEPTARGWRKSCGNCRFSLAAVSAAATARTLDRPVAPRASRVRAELQYQRGRGKTGNCRSFFLHPRAVRFMDLIDQVGTLRVRADVNAQSAASAPRRGVVPVGLPDMVPAEPAHLRHVWDAHGHVGIEQVAQAARLGVVARRCRIASHGPAAPNCRESSQNAFGPCEIGRPGRHTGYAPAAGAAAMHHRGDVEFRVRLLQRLEDDRIGQRIADPGAGEAQDAGAFPEPDRAHCGGRRCARARKSAGNRRRKGG